MEKTERTTSDWIKIGLPAALFLVVGFILAFQFVGPAPPKIIRIASGAEGGRYHELALKYSEYLKREGIDLQVIETAGSMENLDLLNQPTSTIDVALVQGGLANSKNAPTLQALGSMYYEPLWVFYRKGVTLKDLRDLKGKRVALGRVGSGTRALAEELLSLNGVDSANTTLTEDGGTKGTEALMNNDVDAAFFVTSPETAYIRILTRNPDIELYSFTRAEAYARTLPYLATVTLPEGALDFSKNIPDKDILLIAPAANLIAKDTFHPALTDLLLQAAADVHSSANILSRSGKFPTPEHCDIAISKDAKRYYTHGPPFLQRYLPFWLATLVDRMKVMLLPFIILLLPMTKVIPPIFQWRTRRRVVKWYKRLQEIDVQIRTEGAAALPDLLKEINQMDTDVSQVSIPLGYADQLYNLRLHIELIQNRIEKAMAQE